MAGMRSSPPPSFLASTALTGTVDAKALKVGLTSDAVSFDPQAAEELSSNILFYHIYDPLVRRKSDLSFGPGLAESWELTDATTWVFKLRKGVKFHNGTEFKASDVVFTLDRLKKSLMANLGANISAFRAIDDYTVEIKTPRPYAVLPNDLAAVLILSEKYAKEVGNEKLDLKPIGTGPYKMVEWIKEDHISLGANRDYFAGAPKIDTVTFRPITNGATRTAALLTGEVDVIQDLNVRDVSRVKSDERYKVLTQPSLLNIVLSIDNREKIADDCAGQEPDDRSARPRSHGARNRRQRNQQGHHERLVDSAPTSMCRPRIPAMSTGRASARCIRSISRKPVS